MILTLLIFSYSIVGLFAFLTYKFIYKITNVKDPFDLWIEALESGKYQQTVNVLRKEDYFCCLGVGCDIYDHNEWYKIEDSDSNYHFLDNHAALPSEVETWLGVNANDYVFKYNGENYTLMGLNDRAKLNFKQIAQLLKQEKNNMLKSKS
ncbi:MAG: hypothetical protein IPO78_17170 [Saprospiraceae bacterium]|nr:hypothetical protein [Saprospiraceae bacterium]